MSDLVLQPIEDPKEILEAAFARTNTAIQETKAEAEGDVETETDYTAKAVLSRVKEIERAFQKDLKKLAKRSSVTAVVEDIGEE